MRLQRRIAVLTGKRLFVVEDSPIVKLGLEAILREAGAMIVETLDDEIDAAILDVNLGHGVSSAPIADKLSQRDVPFLFYSGQSESFLASIRKKFPAALVLIKPCDPARIIREVARLSR